MITAIKVRVLPSRPQNKKSPGQARALVFRNQRGASVAEAIVDTDSGDRFGEPGIVAEERTERGASAHVEAVRGQSSRVGAKTVDDEIQVFCADRPVRCKPVLEPGAADGAISGLADRNSGRETAAGARRRGLLILERAVEAQSARRPRRLSNRAANCSEPYRSVPAGWTANFRWSFE